MKVYWRKNLEEGLDKINKARINAENAHIKEQVRLNAERAENGLPSCPEGVPTKLMPEQVLRETIRRYNCGVEYRWEPRDDPDCKGGWVSYQSCDADDGADVNYVENVLACKL